MTRDKDRKRIIRNRMKKTGESYTTARAHVIAQAKPKQPPAPAVDYAALAGMSDTAISSKTARTWKEWVRTLDAEGAATMPHRDIALLVHRKYGVGEWWTQSVTVGYERIKGLRERGQRRSGLWEATKSKTFDVPVKALFASWTNNATRRRWLDGVNATVRSATPPKYLRLLWPDGTLVAVGFTAKGARKSAVAVSHMKLRDKATAEDTKKYWTERLNVLGSVLTTASAE